MTPFSAAVLVGGQGKRMGRDKAFLPVGGIPSLQWIIQALLPLTDDLLLVTNNDEKQRRVAELVTPQAPNVRFVTDVFPGTGTLGGIFSALQSANSPYCLIVGCDMPFLKPALLQFLAGLAPHFQAVVPMINGRYQPLHAIYHKDCLDAIEADLRNNRLKATGFLAQVTFRTVTEAEILPLDPELISFRNMNTPEEWRALDQLASTRS